MLGEVVDLINRKYQHRLDNLTSLANQRYDANYSKAFLSKENVLTSDEKEEIKSKWGSIIPYLERGYDFYRRLKDIYGFSADFLPSSYYFPIVEGALNPKPYKFELSHKSIADVLYKDVVKFPHTVLRQYNGMYFDYGFNPVTPQEAAKILRNEEETLIFKPAKFTVQGMGIELMDKAKKNEFAKSLESNNCCPPEFVIQRLVKQGEDTALLNQSSLNTMRITTLNLNGEISICSSAMKFGPTGSIIDNTGSGKKGIFVGLNDDGTFYSYGSYGNGEISSSHNGFTLKGRKIRNFDKVIETAINLHRINTTCKLIGWDLAIDNSGEVVLIESNAAHPGIAVVQMATGPIFGERTDEVIEYVKYKIKS